MVLQLLAEVERSSTFEVDPNLGLILWSLYLLLAAAAGLTCLLRRRWLILLVGFPTVGLAWFYGVYLALAGRGTRRALL